MPAHVKEVFEGNDGLLAGLNAGKIWIDHSTTDFKQTQDFHAQVIEKGADLLEAPVTGGLEALKKGQMTVLMSGNKKLADEVL